MSNKSVFLQQKFIHYYLKMNDLNNLLVKISKTIAAFTIPLSLIANSSYAEVPDSAKITEIIGSNSLGISVARSRNYRPVAVGTVMRSLDKLDVPSSGRTFATLEFYDALDRFMGLSIQAGIKNQLRTSYYFPCLVETQDSFIVEWTNEKTGKRACERGFKVRVGNRQKSALLEEIEDYALGFSKQLLFGQTAPNRWQYCSVSAKSGKGWVNVANSDPCKEPLQKCEEIAKGECAIATSDRWDTKQSNLTALFTCANKQEFTAKGDGSNIKDLVYQLWQQAENAGAKSCALHVFGTEDTIVQPLNKQELTLVEIRNTDPCFTFDAYQGAATAISTKNPEGIPLKPGDRYLYCQKQETDSNANFDPSIESIDVQIFRARKRGYKLCDEQQASGGQEGDTRTIQLTSTSGVIKIDYEMYSVPDRLRVIYEDRDLVNTGFVSGSKSLSIPFQGNSGRVTVELTGNQQESGTQWNYTLHCPQ
jgi:hypothetical protein